MSEMCCCCEGTNEMRDDRAAGEAIRSDDRIYVGLGYDEREINVERCMYKSEKGDGGERRMVLLK